MTVTRKIFRLASNDDPVLEQSWAAGMVGETSVSRDMAAPEGDWSISDSELPAHAGIIALICNTGVSW